jgi:hypothetical protein
MAKKHSIGVSTFKKNTKIKRKGRHSKSHKKAKFSRGQGKPN